MMRLIHGKELLLPPTSKAVRATAIFECQTQISTSLTFTTWEMTFLKKKLNGTVAIFVTSY